MIRKYNLQIYKNLSIILFIFLSFLHVSCTTVPLQKQLTKKNMIDIQKVAIVVTLKAPEVNYASYDDRYTGSSVGVIFGPVGLILGTAIESSVKKGIDQKHAEKIQEQVSINSLKDNIALSFIEHLNQAKCFKLVECINCNTSNEQRPNYGDYDAVIRLSVDQIVLRYSPGGYVRLHLKIHGQMENFLTKEIVWDREENASNPEPHPLEYYKENGLKELDAILAKAIEILSYDFVYLR